MLKMRVFLSKLCDKLLYGNLPPKAEPTGNPDTTLLLTSNPRAMPCMLRASSSTWKGKWPLQKVKVGHKPHSEPHAFLQHTIGSAAVAIQRSRIWVCAPFFLFVPGFVGLFLQLRGQTHELHMNKNRVPERELLLLRQALRALCWAKGWSGNFHPSIQPGLPFPLPLN